MSDPLKVRESLPNEHFVALVGPWWKRMLFLHGPHFIARRLRVIRMEEDEAS